MNDRALELGEDAKHLKHGFAARRCGVNALLMQEQVNTSGVDFREKADQVLKASAEAIDRPSHYHVELPPGGRFVKVIELRPLV